MAEIGEVIGTKEARLIVKLQRQEACAKCKGCLAGMQSEEMLAEAENLCHAKVGDFVEISMEKSNFLKAVAIMYTIPLIAFVFGIGIGFVITHSEIFAVAVGLIMTGITYRIIRSQNHRFENESYRPFAVKIVDKDGQSQ